VVPPLGSSPIDNRLRKYVP
jgi:hypothetical protein